MSVVNHWGVKLVSVLLALSIALVMPMGAVQAQVQEGRGEIVPIESPVRRLPTGIPGMPGVPAQEGFDEAIIEIAEDYMEANPDGTLTLNMPRRVIRAIGADTYALLQGAIAVANEKVSAGYLKFDEDFNAYVTEKYLDKAKANIALHSQLNQELRSAGISASDISVSRSGNSITVDFGILSGGGGGGGVTRVTWHWWGVWIYLSDWLADAIVKGLISAAGLTGIFIAVGLPPKVAAAIIGVLALMHARISFVNRHNTGVRFQQFYVLGIVGKIAASYVVAWVTMQPQ